MISSFWNISIIKKERKKLYKIIHSKQNKPFDTPSRIKMLSPIPEINVRKPSRKRRSRGCSVRSLLKIARIPQRGAVLSLLHASLADERIRRRRKEEGKEGREKGEPTGWNSCSPSSRGSHPCRRITCQPRNDVAPGLIPGSLFRAELWGRPQKSSTLWNPKQGLRACGTIASTRASSSPLLLRFLGDRRRLSLCYEERTGVSRGDETRERKKKEKEKTVEHRVSC